MEANELRIGNVIKSGKGMYRIYALSFPMILAIQCLKSDIQSEEGIFSSAFTIIEPIPLTEEILLKVGFDKMGHEWMDKEICLEIFQGWLHFSAGEGLKLSTEIKYLHQLQNLYFALTGQELDVSKLI